MTPEETARSTADATSHLPAQFMLDAETYKRGAELGFDGIDYYFAGRAGALGDVDADVVSSAFVYFNPVTIADALERSGKVMPPLQAAGEFAATCHLWAEAHLGDGVDYVRLSQLLGKVKDNASSAGAPLFAGWRAIAEPRQPKSLALHRLNLLRELRGGLHACAVIAAGIEPRVAMMVRSPFMSQIFGWSEPHPDPEPVKASWEQAEAATNRAMAKPLCVLDDSERAELVDLLEVAYKPFAG